LKLHIRASIVPVPAKATARPDAREPRFGHGLEPDARCGVRRPVASLPALSCCAPSPLPKGWCWYAPSPNLRYNRASETAAGEPDGDDGRLAEAFTKRGHLVSRRSWKSRRPYRHLLLRIASR
jgi:hypothetical protein